MVQTSEEKATAEVHGDLLTEPFGQSSAVVVSRLEPPQAQGLRWTAKMVSLLAPVA